MVSDIRKKDAQAAIKRGIKCRDAEDYDRAITEFSDAVKLDPDNAAAYHNRGYIYVNRITKQMHEAGKLDPNDANDEPVIRLGILENAIRDFNTALRLDPKNPDAYVGRAAAYNAKGNPRMAVKDYKAALKLGLEPNTAREIRQLLMTIGSTQEQYEYYAVAVRNGAVLTHPQEYINIGAACYNKNLFEAAIQHYTRAIELDPKSADAYFRRAEAYAQLWRFRDAINDYTDVVKIDPNYDEAYRGRGNACTNTGDIDLAIESYTEAIRINPNNANAYSGRANAYGYQERYDDALKDCEEAVKLDPENPKTYETRGMVYKSKKRFEEAISDYTEAIRLDPTIAETYYRRGVVYSMEKQHEPAIMDFTRTIKLAPNFAGAYHMRGVAYYNLNRLDEAVKNVEKAHKLDLDNEEIAATLHKLKNLPRNKSK
jgi:tetratricopeptide (TPR) repeat protein